MNYVVTHPEWGVFVGLGGGLAFWSKIDPVGQPAVVCFATEADAQIVVVGISPEYRDACKIVPVNCEGPWLTSPS